MIVRCVATTLDSLPSVEIRDHVREYVHLESIALRIGEHYQVFGIFFRTGIPWYLLCEEFADHYPVPYCSSFFELVDGTIGAGWSLSLRASNVGEVAILPDAWARDSRFLERLVEGDADAVSEFESIKLLEKRKRR